jgi:hypothetical protein
MKEFDNYGKPTSLYIEKLKEMDKDQLLKETEGMIFLSAFAGNNPKSDYHWQCDACYDECVSRDGLGLIYNQAYKNTTAGLK